MMKRVLSVLLLLVATMNCWARPLEVSGRVFCKGEGGIEGVVVTDGFNFATTNSKGDYKMLLDARATQIYISTPAGYVTECNGSRPQFFRPVEDKAKGYDFELWANPKDNGRHTALVTADVQMTSLDDVKSYGVVLDDMVKVASEVEGDVFSLDCGDIVGDSPWLYEPYLKVADKGGIPTFRAIGNHDMNYYGDCHESSYATFEKTFSPARYSFNKKGAHYVVLNNNFYVGRDYFYIGYCDQATIDWLRGDLKYVPKGTLLVVVQHIPVRMTDQQKPFEYTYGYLADQTTNAAALLRIVEGYDAHFITGHMHLNLNVEHAEGPMEHNTGAVCGTWWKGEICLDGTPRGYGVYEVKDGKLEWYFKSSGFPKEHQLRAYKAGWLKDEPQAVVANVWNWDSKWSVEMWENGVKTATMERFTGYDKAAYELCSDKEKVVYDWIGPVQTPHLFKAVPTNVDADIEIRVIDRFGNQYVAKPE